MAVIDLTDRYIDYAHPDFDWWIPEPRPPIEAITIHHTVGYYGPKLTEQSTEAEEIAAFDALAADHFNRFGIGPGYWYGACPSGRARAIGKHGTHRAHCLGRSPTTLHPWNVVGRGVVVFGNYEAEEAGDALIAATLECVDDLRSYIEDPDAPIVGHGDMPTVNRWGNPFSQETACPGRSMVQAIADSAFGDPPAPPEIDIEAAETLALQVEATINAATGMLGRAATDAERISAILRGETGA